MSAQGKIIITTENNGLKIGNIVIPWSRNSSAWGNMCIPVAFISSGRPGPTILVVGGNHGDEYEGPIAINHFIRTIDPAKTCGEIILIPALNYPALKKGTRLSPIDGANMNRSFTGKNDGTLTEKIACFVEENFIEKADAVLDIHSGGRTLEFHPCAIAHKTENKKQNQKALEALKAFAAPVGLFLTELDDQGMLDSAVEKRGKLFISTELGGGGSTSPQTIMIAKRGLHNFLVHTGALEDDMMAPDIATELMGNNDDGYIMSNDKGLVEYFPELGDKVKKGQTLAIIYDIDALDKKPVEVKAPVSGTLLGRLHGGMVGRGDFLGLIADKKDGN